jgi:hypothetical protein
MVRTHNLKRSLASRFRRMFARYEQTSRAGRGAHFQIHISTDKADKSCKDFCFFETFFSKKKVDSVSKAARLSQNRKNLLFKEVFFVSERFFADIAWVWMLFL